MARLEGMMVFRSVGTEKNGGDNRLFPASAGLSLGTGHMARPEATSSVRRVPWHSPGLLLEYVMHLAIKGNCARHGHLRVLPCTAVMISRAGSQRRGLHALPVSIANTSHRCTGGQRMLAAVVRRACSLQGDPLR